MHCNARLLVFMYSLDSASKSCGQIFMRKVMLTPFTRLYDVQSGLCMCQHIILHHYIHIFTLPTQSPQLQALGVEMRNPQQNNCQQAARQV